MTVVDVCIFRPGEQGVDPRWLMWWMNSPAMRQRILDLQTGTTRKRISRRNLSTIELPVPPLTEQLRIVDLLEYHLSAVADGQGQLTQAQNRLRRLELVLLQSAVERRAPHWEEVRIGDLARVTSGATPNRSRPEYYERGSIPWITSSQLNLPFIQHATQFITDRALKETSVKLLEPGTLLLAMYGEGKTRGKCSELTIEATTNQACAAIALRPAHAELLPWLKVTLEARYESNRRLSSGGVQPNLNLGLIKDMIISVPPVEERKEILDKLEIGRTVQARLVSELVDIQNRVASLRRVLLGEAFAGRLAAQDPNDEPASVLLKRIKAERWAQPKPKRDRRPTMRTNHDQESTL